MVDKMDSAASNSSPDNRKGAVVEFELPVFDQPLVEHWPSKMSWAEAMRHFAPARERFMREFDFPEKRWREKNPAPFVLP